MRQADNHCGSGPAGPARRPQVDDLAHHLSNELGSLLQRHASVMQLELTPGEASAAISAAAVDFLIRAVGASVCLISGGAEARRRGFDIIASTATAQLAESRDATIAAIGRIFESVAPNQGFSRDPLDLTK